MNKKIIAIVLLVTIALTAPLGVWQRNQSAPKLRFVAESQACKAVDCFEGISHYRYLYEGETKISQVGTESLSPSGNYAAFEEDGKLMLYKRGSGNLEEITEGNFAVPASFLWDEAQSQLIITYYNQNGEESPIKGHPNSIIKLD